MPRSLPRLAASARRAANWLRDDLAELRRRGYRQVVVAGQSRGGWDALMILNQAGLADVVIAIAPAAHGTLAENNNRLHAQIAELEALLTAADKAGGHAWPLRISAMIPSWRNPKSAPRRSGAWAQVSGHFC